MAVHAVSGAAHHRYEREGLSGPALEPNCEPSAYTWPPRRAHASASWVLPTPVRRLKVDPLGLPALAGLSPGSMPEQRQRVLGMRLVQDSHERPVPPAPTEHP